MCAAAITAVDHPGRDVAGELAALVERLGAGDAPPVGERKRVQLHGIDDAPWTALIAAGDDGAPLAYAHVRWEEPDRTAGLVATAELAVADDAPDLADRLLAAVRTAVGDAGGGPWQLWAHREVACRAADRAGLATTRELLLMHRPLHDADDADPALPAAVTLARFREGVDEDALIAVNNAAFAGHPEQGEWTRADVVARRSAPWYDPDDVLLAWRGEQLLGFHWTKRHPPEQEEVPVRGPLGEVYVLAVAPEAQGLGVGRALLRAGLAHLVRRGCREVALFVDAGEPAVALYAAEGFATLRTHRSYAGEEPGSMAPTPRGAAAGEAPAGGSSSDEGASAT